MIGYLIPNLTARLGLRLQQIALGPDRRAHRRHELLADRVERRIRHLREQLLEVVEQQPRLVRQHGQRRVGAHRADRLLAVDGHRPDQHAQVFLRVAERLLPLQHRFVIGLLGARAAGRSLMSMRLPVEPLAIRMLRRQLPLDLVVVDDAALGRVDEEDAPGMQPLLDEHVLGRNVEHADLRRHDDQVVLGDVVARRTQSVAIEHRADDRAVGERDRRRAVPRLHQRRVVLVERLAIGVHRCRSRSTAPGIIIRIACGSDRPVIIRNSSTLSKMAVSLPPSRMHRQHLLQVVAEQVALRAVPRARASS